MDVRGSGFSSRVPLLLHSDRPLLYIERPNLLTWYESSTVRARLRPWVHYVPVQPNLTDLVEQSRWVLTHAAQAQAIADNALQYARCFLTMAYAQSHLTRTILAASECAEECFDDRVRCGVCQLGSSKGSRFRQAFDRFAWVEGELPPQCTT